MSIIDRRSHSMGGTSKRGLKSVTNIAIHHSATKQGNSASFERHWKNVRNWVTGGYHEVVLLNGDVEINYSPSIISNGVSNHNSVTYNICYVGDGQPNSKQLETLKSRVSYNAKRLNVPISKVRGHREFSGTSTSCPSLDMKAFRSSLGGESTPSSNKPSKSIRTLADEVIQGKHGSGNVRKKKLGSKYNEVQKEVNRILSGGKSTGKSVETLAREVIQGKHGVGRKRKQSLGNQYKEVQKEVNRLMR